jgi:hypothetical protein
MRLAVRMMEGRAMKDTAWSWVFIVIVVMFGLAFGG